MTTSATRWLTIAVCLFGLPHVAAAQEASSTPAPLASQAPRASQGSMTLEPVDNGFVIAPDFKYTEIDKSAARLAGVYGGFVFDQTVLFGAAGYWQTNQTTGPRMSYGGALVKWLVQDAEPVGFSLGALLGGGEARLPTTINVSSLVRDTPTSTPHVVTTPTSVLLRDQFFVFEPEADVNLRLAPQVRLAVGVGYRAIGEAFNSNDRLQGASGTVSLQFFTSPQTRSQRP